MSTNLKWGIGDIALYVPEPRMSLDRLLDERTHTNPDLEMILRRAAKKTGQVSFRFPDPWEDTASLAANATARALDRIDKADISGIRFLVTGTETAIDHSKPTASYVQGMLQQADYPLGSAMTTFEVKHACAGGTAGLLAVASMLKTSGRSGERGLAVNADIARYDAPSTAEITQGAGAAAVVIEESPRLLELDLDNVGLYASDVDDFFRPLGSVTAKVKGRYSMECYQEALEKAFLDYCGRAGLAPCETIDSIDYVALHVPFARMPETALYKLLTNVCDKSRDETEEYMASNGFKDALYLNSSFGNLYTGSLSAYIVALLHQQYERKGDDIVGKNLLIGSYGSGNTMLVLRGTIAAGAPKVIESWNVPGLMSSGREASFADYLNWLARPTDLDAWDDLLGGAKPTAGQFYLRGFGETGLRLYGRG